LRYISRSRPGGGPNAAGIAGYRSDRCNRFDLFADPLVPASSPPTWSGTRPRS